MENAATLGKTKNVVSRLPSATLEKTQDVDSRHPTSSAVLCMDNEFRNTRSNVAYIVRYGINDFIFNLAVTNKTNNISYIRR